MTATPSESIITTHLNATAKRTWTEASSQLRNQILQHSHLNRYRIHSAIDMLNAGKNLSDIAVKFGL